MNRIIQNDNDSQVVSKGSVYVISELSANHNQDFNQAVQLMEAAAEVGVDAVKLQTYTPDTITIDCDNEYFEIGQGTLWEGKTLYELYGEAFTPWEWHPKLKEVADELELDLFSSPFDHTAVDYLELMDVPAYKIASFEIIDLPLIRKIARTQKPIIMSTGMANLAEIEEAVNVIRAEGNDRIALLKCTSAYPARPEDINLRTIPHLGEAFDVQVGLSDHTLGIAVPLAAVAIGACIIEKHLTLSRDLPGPDRDFSLEPHEFRTLVEAIRIVEKAIGKVQYEPSESELASRVFRRSLFVVEDVAKGEVFTTHSIRSIRPGYGMHPRFLDDVIGKRATKQISRGTPLSPDLISHRL